VGSIRSLGKESACGGLYQAPVDITRNVDMAQLDVTNGPGSQESVTR